MGKGGAKGRCINKASLDKTVDGFISDPQRNKTHLLHNSIMSQARIATGDVCVVVVMISFLSRGF